jgi:hypothetical protein
MVLTPHALIGAAIYTFIPNPLIGLPLAFLSHFLADWIPHNHYHSKTSENGEFAISFNNFLKVGADFAIGMALCSVIAWQHQNILFILAGFLAMFPDALSFFELLYKKYSLPAKKFVLPPLQSIRKFHLAIHAKEDPRKIPFMLLQPTIAITSLLIGLWRYS